MIRMARTNGSRNYSVSSNWLGRSVPQWLQATRHSQRPVNTDWRHLSKSQIAIAAAAMLPYEEARAKERQGKRTDLTSAPNGADVGKAAKKVADTSGVSERLVQRGA